MTDVLYGKVNPQGKSPFTWGKSAEDYGAQLLYNSTTPLEPIQNFTEGVFIDYRWLDHASIEPVYEFGYGLSYTTFKYTNLTITTHDVPAYIPAGGVTAPAPTYGTVDMDVTSNMVPPGFEKISPFVYPWVNGPSVPSGGGGTAPTNGLNGSAQPVLPAGGAPGGNTGLYDVLYTITALLQNTGNVTGTEIPQLVNRNPLIRTWCS